VEEPVSGQLGKLNLRFNDTKKLAVVTEERKPVRLA
jgi:hypothetical protein